MPKQKDPLLIALEKGESFTWTLPEGGDLASMRATLKHGQTLTMSPVRRADEVHVGDVVVVRWHGGVIYHQVGEIKDGRFLIVNSLGKANGWVEVGAILGRVSKTIDPEPRPKLADMLTQLRKVYSEAIDRMEASPESALRLQTVIDDLDWYASRLGTERSDAMPRGNRWSFEQNLWKLLREAKQWETREKDIEDVIDSGKECVGAAAEIMMFFASARKG